MPCNWSTTANILSQRFFSSQLSPSTTRRLKFRPIRTPASTSQWRSLVTIAPRPDQRHDSYFASHHIRSLEPSLCHSRSGPRHGPAAYSSATHSSTKAAFIPEDPPPIDIADLSSHWSSPALSRAGAQAVRMSLANNSIFDAYHLWNSLRWSVHNYDATPGPKVKFVAPTRRFEPIDFGKAVSPRLAAHALVHFHLRRKDPRNAAKVVNQMLLDGTECSVKTFEAVLLMLHPTNSGGDRSSFNKLTSYELIAPLAGKEAMNLKNVLPEDPLTRVAVRLLREARKHRWQRTQMMYDVVISACIIQGEVIAATLLLGFLIYDYQLRKACVHIAEQGISAAEVEGVLAKNLDGSTTIPRRKSRHGAPPVLPMIGPSQSLQNIVDLIADPIAHGPDHPLFADCSQSLANIAGLLDTQQLPTTHIAQLITVLSSYPENDHKVWVKMRSGRQASYNAYQYFHAVLVRLIRSLPVSEPPPLQPSKTYPTPLLSPSPSAITTTASSLSRTSTTSDPLPRSSLPPLTLFPYNTLLRYALQHRFNWHLGHLILKNMMEDRQPPLVPDVTTFTILLRACTLQRKNNVAHAILTMFRFPSFGAKEDEDRIAPKEGEEMDQEYSHEGVSQPVAEPNVVDVSLEGSSGDIVVQPVESRPSSLSSPSPEVEEDRKKDPYSQNPYNPTSRAIVRLIYKIKSQTPQIPTPSADVHVDTSFLCAFISHLISTGRPDAVSSVIFLILPELGAIEHPSWDTLSLTARRELREQNRVQCIKRASHMGPYFFSTVLNALAKTGKTGLAERVWLLAKNAEAASWLEDAEVRPWCLSVHAYTSMMECYANEARKGLDLKTSNPRRRVALRSFMPELYLETGEKARKKRVVGWAHYVQTLRVLGGSKKSARKIGPRNVTGKKLGRMLYKSMRLGAASIYESLKWVQARHRDRLPAQGQPQSQDWSQDLDQDEEQNQQDELQNQPRYNLRQPIRRHMQVPEPDERFFNAVLSMYGQRPNAPRHNACTSRARWRRKLRRARSQYAEGYRRPKRLYVLESVLKDMLACGFEVPVAFHIPLMGGAVDLDAVNKVRRKAMVRPYAFPPVGRRQRLRPRKIPTVKTRGLPIGSTRARWREVASE